MELTLSCEKQEHKEDQGHVAFTVPLHGSEPMQIHKDRN